MVDFELRTPEQLEAFAVLPTKPASVKVIASGGIWPNSDFALTVLHSKLKCLYIVLALQNKEASVPSQQQWLSCITNSDGFKD